MFDIIQSTTFKAWLTNLKDRQVVQRIQARIRRASLGNLGDVKPIREGISEMRIDCGSGYRVYFMRRGQVVLVLLAGGDKQTQDADIKRALEMAKNWQE